MTLDKTNRHSGENRPLAAEVQGAVPGSDVELDGALAALIAEVGKEDVPDRIRTLAQELEQALLAARRKG